MLATGSFFIITATAQPARLSLAGLARPKPVLLVISAIPYYPK